MERREGSASVVKLQKLAILSTYLLSLNRIVRIDCQNAINAARIIEKNHRASAKVLAGVAVRRRSRLTA
jgi:hypothetical protein